MRALYKHKNNVAVIPLQEKLNAVWDVIFTLPFYRDLPLDKHSSLNLLPMLVADEQKWAEVFQDNSESNKMFMEFLDKLEYFAESIRNFKGQIAGMLELYFENLTRRSSEAYAQAYSKYYRDMVDAGELLWGLADKSPTSTLRGHTEAHVATQAIMLIPAIICFFI